MYNIEIKHGANIKIIAVSKIFIPQKKKKKKYQIMFEFLIILLLYI